MSTLKAMQNDVDQGQLQINVVSRDAFPVEDATITLSYTGAPESTLEVLQTDSSGQTEIVTLSTPPLDYSMAPSEYQPYSQYTIVVTAPGFRPLNISGIALLPEELAVQPVTLLPQDYPGQTESNIVIGAHTLFGDYPPKIPESEIKPMNETGEIVLSRVVIPEYVVVHDGAPTDSTAANYYVRYRDYIKNVASSEIYATWPDSSLRANILAIMSFTLNRVYTEWYRNQGYEFTITSSTAYDHKFIYGRNIYRNISNIVDEIFTNYLSRPNVRQPILTQYCDGHTTTCPNWMTVCHLSENFNQEKMSITKSLRRSLAGGTFSFVTFSLIAQSSVQ
ncbi:MAG: carboxypeptidase regulatory-like domain-containing protein [Lachnospiraceae bacterium]|nr:carboxypeptidase regulatory-like domain-containing protein [Lachnospiraceae bacterium]